MSLKRIGVLLSLLLLSSHSAAAQTAAGSSSGAVTLELLQKVHERNQEAFIESVEKGDAAAVRLFLAAGMSPDAGQDRTGGEAALLRAVRGRHEEVVKVLLEAGADVNVRGNPDLVSALSLAVEAGRPRIVRALLDHKADVDAGDEDGHTNLITATMNASLSVLPRETLRFISDDETDEDADRLLRTPRRERMEILRMLLDAGAELDGTATDCGLSALMLAALSGDAEVVRMLLERGADPDMGKKDWNALRFASMPREELLQNLTGDAADAGAAEEHANADDGRRQTALVFFKATEKGRAESARLLREAGAREPWAWQEEEGRGDDAPPRSPGAR